MLREYDDMKEEIKNLKNSTVHQSLWFSYKTMLSDFLKCTKKKKKRDSENTRVTKTIKGKTDAIIKMYSVQ